MSSAIWNLFCDPVVIQDRQTPTILTTVKTPPTALTEQADPPHNTTMHKRDN